MMNNQYQNEREELNSAISRLNSENIRLLSEVEQYQLKIQEQEKRIEEFSSLPEKFQSVIGIYYFFISLFPPNFFSIRNFFLEVFSNLIAMIYI